MIADNDVILSAVVPHRRRRHRRRRQRGRVTAAAGSRGRRGNNFRSRGHCRKWWTARRPFLVA